jgi:hypothetical protein
LYGLLLSILEFVLALSGFSTFLELWVLRHVTQGGEKGFSAVPTAIIGSRDRSPLPLIYDDGFLIAVCRQQLPSAAPALWEKYGARVMTSKPWAVNLPHTLHLLLRCLPERSSPAFVHLELSHGKSIELCAEIVVSSKCESCDWVFKQPQATRMSSSSIPPSGHIATDKRIHTSWRLVGRNRTE